MRRNIVILILIFIFTVLPAAGETYMVFVDREFGFWAVRSDNISHNLTYKSRTLNINTGDSVEWVNMDGGNDRVTVMSDNLLWENGSVLSGTGSKFRFTFNSSGTYRFHVAENTRTFLNASNYTEIDLFVTYYYKDEDGEIHTITIKRETKNIKDYLKKVVETERYPYQYMVILVSGVTIGNGTKPVRAVSEPVSYVVTRKTVSVDARMTPKAVVTPTPALTPAPTPVPMESYQEFTLYEIIKRWYEIIVASNMSKQQQT